MIARRYAILGMLLAVTVSGCGGAGGASVTPVPAPLVSPTPTPGVTPTPTPGVTPTPSPGATPTPTPGVTPTPSPGATPTSTPGATPTPGVTPTPTPGVTPTPSPGATPTPFSVLTLSVSNASFTNTGAAYAQTIAVIDALDGTDATVSGCAGIVSTSLGSGTSNRTLTVTPLAAGSCTLTVADRRGGSASLAVGVTVSQIGVQ